MDKYQKALDRLNSINMVNFIGDAELIKHKDNDIKTLQELVDKEILMKEFTKQDKQVFDIFKEYIICDYVKEMSFDTFITSQCSPVEEKIFSDWYKKNKERFTETLEL